MLVTRKYMLVMRKYMLVTGCRSAQYMMSLMDLIL